MSDEEDPVIAEVEEYYEKYRAVNNAGKSAEIDMEALLSLVDLPYGELSAGAPLVVRTSEEESHAHFREGFDILDRSDFGPLQAPHTQVWPLARDLAMLSVDYLRESSAGGEPLSGRVIYILTKRSGDWRYAFYVYLEPGFTGPDSTPPSGGAAFTGLGGK